LLHVKYHLLAVIDAAFPGELTHAEIEMLELRHIGFVIPS